MAADTETAQRVLRCGYVPPREGCWCFPASQALRGKHRGAAESRALAGRIVRGAGVDGAAGKAPEAQALGAPRLRRSQRSGRRGLRRGGASSAVE